MRWHSISLIGAGVLGGSLALAAQASAIGRQGHGARPARVHAGRMPETEHRRRGDARSQRGRSGGRVGDSLHALSRKWLALAAEMGPFLKQGAIVTDVGSVKGTVVRDLEPLVRQAGAVFVGSHPMAGSEKTGVAAARADLFENAVCLVTPGRQSTPEAVARVEDFWKALGGLSAPSDARGARRIWSAGQAICRTSWRRNWPITF